MAESKKVMTNFQDRVVYFMGNVDATLTTINNRLTNIEGRIGTTCLAHDSMLQLMNNQKDTNINQKGQNVEVQKHQNIQDVGIRDLQEQSRIIEYKISNKDLAKISAIVIPLTTIVLFIMEKVFR